MNELKVKDILNYIAAQNITVVQIHYYAGPKPTHKKILYKYWWDDEIGDYDERIYEEDFQQRKVAAIEPKDCNEIEIRVFRKDY